MVVLYLLDEGLYTWFSCHWKPEKVRLSPIAVVVVVVFALGELPLKVLLRLLAGTGVEEVASP
jgi:hypothetical protein